MGVPSDPVKVDTTTPERPARLLGIRHLIMLLLFLATATAYAARVTLSVAVVAMTSTSNDHGHIDFVFRSCDRLVMVWLILQFRYYVFHITWTMSVIFDWERSIQDTLLSSFFWGYVVLQLPGGMAAARWGGKWLVFTGILVNGIVLMFLPFAAKQGGWIAVCVCRIVMGLTQGVLYPSFHGILGQWAPESERSRMGTFVYAGGQFGTVVEMAIGGIIAASPWGWPGIFQATGAACLLWAAVWFVVGASRPRESRFISEEERVYIEAYARADVHANKMATPWRSIMTSLPFLSIVIAHTGQSLGFWTLLTEMPSYMANVLDVDIKSNGVLSALPYVAMFVLSWVFSWTADAVYNSGRLRTGTVRKIFNTIAFWGPAVALLALSFIPPGHTILAVSLLTITVGLNGAHYVGFMMSHIDMAPNFASTLMGVTNGVGNVASILAPYSATIMIHDQNNASDWQKVFFIAIGFYFLANLFYILFATGEKQPWNDVNAEYTDDYAFQEQKMSNEGKKTGSSKAEDKV